MSNGKYFIPKALAKICKKREKHKFYVKNLAFILFFCIFAEKFSKG